MGKIFFENIYSDLPIPVTICNVNDMEVEYINKAGSLLLIPSYSVDVLTGKAKEKLYFKDIIKFINKEESNLFNKLLNNEKLFDEFVSNVKIYNDENITLRISGNNIWYEGKEYIIFYIQEDIEWSTEGANYNYLITEIINTTFLTDDAEENIQMILSLAGGYVGASRAYIFEEIDEETTANTYEWVDKGEEPVIQDLQNLRKEDYNYDVIINSGMYITNNVSELPTEDKDILEAQGIKALAIVTIYDVDKPLGYVGFDDCIKYRRWSKGETQFLKNISGLLGTFIKKRNIEKKLLLNQSVLELISENSDQIIYINNIDDYRLIFVSDSLAKISGVKKEDLLGKVCYKVLQKGKDKPCSFCPIPKLLKQEDRNETYTWEFTNTMVDKTYLVNDSLIEWLDGSLVHLETATDISHRIEFEEKLVYYASTDVMTGAYKREWGYELLEKELNASNGRECLCFFDLDGLKGVNDEFGHDEGDKMIKFSVDIFREFIDEDSNDFICRWGGDEFIVYIHSSYGDTEEKIKKMQKKMENINKAKDNVFNLSFSYGIVEIEDDSIKDLDIVVTEADTLMYKNKMEKRNKFRQRRREDLIKPQ